MILLLNIEKQNIQAYVALRKHTNTVVLQIQYVHSIVVLVLMIIFKMLNIEYKLM